MRHLAPRSWNLTFKMSLTITVVVAVVAFTIGSAIIAYDQQRFRDELGVKAVLLARSVAVTAPDLILHNDLWSLFKSLKNMASGNIHGDVTETRIATAMILAPDGVVLAHLRSSEHPVGLPYKHPGKAEHYLLEQSLAARKPMVLAGTDESDGFLEGVAPIFSDEKFLGVVRVRLSTYELYLKTRRAGLIIIGLTLGMVIIGSLAGAAISRRMTKPLTEMAKGLEAVGRGELDGVAPIQVLDDDELGKLATTFNKMAAGMAEKKKLEEQMAVSEKLVALGRITAGVAHEVNNPLGGMLNCINTLKRHPDNPELLERYLPLIENGLHRIKDIVASLLVELRVEDASNISSPSCLDELKGLVDAEINGRNINFVWQNDLADDIRLNCPRVQQVVHNLLKNSVQMLPDGGSVTFRSFQDGDLLIFEVDDNGPGIPAEHRSHLFDPFFTSRPGGTGLGLWIVYRLVESMRGVIGVESEVGTGTCFRIALPIMETEASE